MDFKKYVDGRWSIWLVLVILWNFGFPHATPLMDVIVSVILSLLLAMLREKSKKSENHQ